MNFLAERFPAVKRIARVDLGVHASPVEQVDVPGAEPLWVKRDDLNAPVLAGNKVRGLEYLLGRSAGHERILTVGGVGSTHVLAVATHGLRLGLPTTAFRWTHHLHPVGRATSDAISRACQEAPVVSSPVEAYGRAAWRRTRGRHLWIPFGGTSPTGILGHVNAALELGEQVRQGLLPSPSVVVCPMGTGGTVAGLLLGLQILGLRTTLVAVRAGPRIGVEEWRIRNLARRAALLLGAPSGGGALTRGRVALSIEHGTYSGEYARPHAGAEALVARLGRASWALDATYSARACYAAVRIGLPGVLLWHTFDGRWLSGDSLPHP